jgi:DNA-binding SARP family transcriptional activator
VRESKSAHLLLCLVLAREHRLPRSHILETLWPETDPALAGQALNSLNHQINKTSARHLNGEGLIVHETGHYQLNASDRHWIDVDHFARWSETGRRLLSTDDVAAGVAYCEQALALYQGDLCGDSSIQTVIERERLRAAFLDLLVRLADHHYGHNDPGKALHYTQRVLAHDPCREDAHRQAMRCYVRLGQRTQAFRH